MSELNKEILLRWYEEGVNNRNIALLEEIFHPDFVFRSISLGGGRGFEEARGYIGAILAAFPDWRKKPTPKAAMRLPLKCVSRTARP